MESQTTLVDLDNISFFKGATRVDVLKLRLKTIHALASSTSSIHWFYNRDTEAMLKREKIVLRGIRHVTLSEKDAVDFEIINHVCAIRNKYPSKLLTTIITADRSLVRLAFYVRAKGGPSMQSIRLSFASFQKGVKLETEVPSPSLFNFKSAHDLGKFASQLCTYEASYPEIPRPVKARTTSFATSKL